VFPSRNLECYWMKSLDTRHIIHSSPHYFFHEFGSFSEFINFVESAAKKKKRKVRILTDHASKGL